MNAEWINRPYLNWCFYCWFNAKIEGKQTPIGIMYLCRNCGVTFREDDEQKPRHFTDEEWYEYWKKNIEIK